MTTTGWLIAAAAVVAIAVLATRPEPPAAAPAGILHDVSGAPVTVADLHHHGPALLWFTNLCDNCQRGFPALDTVARSVARTDATVTAVSFVAGDRNRVAAILAQNRPAFRILLDQAGELTRGFTGAKPARACPLINVFIVGRNGAVLYRSHYPGADPADLTRRLLDAAATH